MVPFVKKYAHALPLPTMIPTLVTLVTTHANVVTDQPPTTVLLATKELSSTKANAYQNAQMVISQLMTRPARNAMEIVKLVSDQKPTNV
jgi:hypothetical protein